MLSLWLDSILRFLRHYISLYSFFCVIKQQTLFFVWSNSLANTGWPHLLPIFGHHYAAFASRRPTALGEFLGVGCSVFGWECLFFATLLLFLLLLFVPALKTENRTLSIVLDKWQATEQKNPTPGTTSLGTTCEILQCSVLWVWLTSFGITA